MVQDVRYFTCPANHGLFVKDVQVTVVQVTITLSILRYQLFSLRKVKATNLLLTKRLTNHKQK